MGKRKHVSVSFSKSVPDFHTFSPEDVKKIRTKLISWYNKNKRDLPWRRNLTISDDNQRAYAVWVSEIMLQQTQVATVINYYNRWMKKWPTLESLSKATLEVRDRHNKEVNEMWSGLGYYSRGRRLHEAAKKVVEELGGEMPKTVEGLLKDLPGVGKYTAGAIASIAYNQPTGLVDGNVIRVFSRLRCIGSDSTSQQVVDTFWLFANSLVDPNSPGDFNQGLMELGATVCTPKSPDCSSCPLKEHCKAYQQVEQHKKINAEKLSKFDRGSSTLVDIECLADDCYLCLPDTEKYEESQGVMNYPRKGKKKAAREERTSVCVLCRKSKVSGDEFLITQRPDSGLLAGLWEFPSCVIDSESQEKLSYKKVLEKHKVYINNIDKQIDVGEVVHIFSHIHQTYVIEGIVVNQSDVEDEDQSEKKWVTRQQFMEAAVSTAMKKVFKAYESSVSGKNTDKKTTLKERNPISKSQRSISSFFKPGS